MNNKKYKILISSITLLFAFVNAILTFITSINISSSNILEKSLLIITIIIYISIGIFVCISKRKSKINNNLYIRFPKQRKIFIFTSILLVFFAICCFFYTTIESKNDNSFLIEVYNFDGPKTENYRITELIYSALDNSFKNENNVDISVNKKSITPPYKREKIKSIADSSNAKIIIWGWYGLSTEIVTLNINFFSKIDIDENILPKIDNLTIGYKREELEQFTMQKEIAEELAFLSKVVIALKYFVEKDWDNSEKSFFDALAYGKNSKKLNFGLAYYYLGVICQETDRNEEAKKHYQNSLELSPDYVTYNNLGILYADEGKYDKAIYFFEKAIEYSENTPVIISNLGLVYQHKGDNQTAIRIYNEGLTKFPNYIQLLERRADAFTRMENFQNALHDLKIVEKNSSDLEHAYLLLGFIYSRMNKFDSSAYYLSKVIKTNPLNLQAIETRAKMRMNFKDYEGALDDISTIIYFTPDCTQFLAFRANAHDSIGNHYAAIADYNKILELENNCVPVKIELGIRYYKQGEFQLAIQYFSEAISLSTQNYAAYFNRGMVYDMIERWEDASIDFEKCLEIDSSQVKPYQFLGEAYLRQGKTKKSNRILTKYISLGGKDYGAFANRGSSYLEMEQFEKAEIDLKRAINLIDNSNNEKSLILLTLGHVCNKLQKHAEAKKYLTEYIKNFQKNSKAYYERGLSEFYLNEDKNAFDDFKISYKLGNIPDAIIRCGIIQYRNQKYKSAINTIEKVVNKCDHKPTRLLGLFILCYSYQNIEEFESALGYLNILKKEIHIINFQGNGLDILEVQLLNHKKPSVPIEFKFE